MVQPQRILKSGPGASTVSLVDEANGDIRPVVGDARYADLATSLLAEHRPSAVLVGGGVTPVMAPLED